MEESSGINEGVLFRLREVLNRDKVRLWLPPYSSEDGHAGIYPEELISQYTRELGFSKPTIAEALEHLRTHALEKLSAKKRFQASGLASIRVHLAGQHSRKMNMEISLKLTGAELRKRLGDEFTMDPVRLKLICNGQVLKEDSPLDSQTVTNNSQILAIALSETEVEARKKLLKDEHAASSLDWTRKAAEALSSRTEDTSNLDYFLEIRDQEGRPLQLPDAERKALALAMTLHEKGKSMLKQKNYSEALVVLLEADKEFSQCRAQILEAVDNYAILCLDVVWCYFGIRSIRDLPDAEARLQKCEECFEKSYGMNMERLTSVRGGSGQELALFVRLYVLQAVCAYHRGRRDHALILLNKAEEWTRKLSVDDDKLSQMVAMGFSVREARLGLRCCHGDVTSAVDHITSKRQEKKERTLREKEEQKKKRAQRKLGKTANGEWVNVSSLESLVDMGFPRQSAAEALRQTNNSMDGALQTLHDHPELLDLPPDDCSSDVTFPEELVTQIASMGFDVAVVRDALRRFRGEVQQAINQLVASGGVLPSASLGMDLRDDPQKPREDPEVKRAVDELVPDLTCDDDAYLDLTLDDEASVIAEYKALILSSEGRCSAR